MRNAQWEWVARRAAFSDDGASLSGASAPRRGQKGWLPASVPETALALLVRNGVLPDPMSGGALATIPDVYHKSDFYTFWWCAQFETPSHCSSSSSRSRTCLGWLSPKTLRADRTPQYQLLLGGANYSLEIWLNGERLVLEHDRGMFLRRFIPVTDLLRSPGETNALAIKVSPPDHVGCVDLGGQGGDHMIAKDVTSQFVEGWDWIQAVPDRNTGLWDAVSLLSTGSVCLRDPHVQVTFQDSGEDAMVSVDVTCVNLTASAISVIVQASVMGLATAWSREVDLGPNQRLEGVSLGAQLVTSPKRWFPMGYGNQTMYEAEVCALVRDAAEVTISHQVSTKFGFRKLETLIDPRTQSRQFVVNDVPVFVRGGNYIVPDFLLRCDRERCWAEVRYHAEMGLNMMRLWGGAGVPLDDLYEACDHYGVMVWSEFWITGDCDGRGSTKNYPQSDPNWPLDHALFLQSAADVVRRLRNHPSLVLWCGGNEQKPCAELDKGLRNLLKTLDGSRRPYVSGSLWGGFGQGGGDWSDGPYGIQDEKLFYSGNYYEYGFNPELGSVGVPCAETMRTIFAASDFPKFVKAADGSVTEVVPESWDYHKYITYGTKMLSYGEPASLEEFCQQAQIINFTQYKSIVEGWASLMWTKYTGILIWKTANPWTALRGQLYDWYLNPTGGYFGVKQCLGERVHIQINRANGNALEVVNVTAEPIEGGRVDVETMDINGGRSHTSFDLDGTLAPLQTTKLTQKVIVPTEGVTFVKLELRSASALASRNVYWLSPSEDYTSLRRWRERGSATITGKVSVNGAGSFSLVLENGTDAVAFFVTAKVSKGAASPATADDLVLPVFLSDNCLTLFPGEAATIEINLETGSGSGSERAERDLKDAVVVVEGWNVKTFGIPLHPNNPLARFGSLD